MEEFFKKKLQQASILGQERKVIWVKFGTFEKNKIMERKKRLGQKPVYIEHDGIREEADVQREIVRYSKELREDNRGSNKIKDDRNG